MRRNASSIAPERIWLSPRSTEATSHDASISSMSSGENTGRPPLPFLKPSTAELSARSTFAASAPKVSSAIGMSLCGSVMQASIRCSIVTS